MKKRLMRILSFTLAVAMIVISLDVPVLATGYDNYVESTEEVISSEEMSDFVVEETAELLSEDVISEEDVDAQQEVLVQEELIERRMYSKNSR